MAIGNYDMVKSDYVIINLIKYVVKMINARLNSASNDHILKRNIFYRLRDIKVFSCQNGTFCEYNVVGKFFDQENYPRGI